MHMYYIVGICVADTHMFYTCNTHKTPHMYYWCGTAGYVLNKVPIVLQPFSCYVMILLDTSKSHCHLVTKSIALLNNWQIITTSLFVFPSNSWFLDPKHNVFYPQITLQ